MDARMSQQAMEGLSDEPESGEKRREPEGQVVWASFFWLLFFDVKKSN